MADLYSDENFPIAIVKELRKLGHNVLTALEAGQANQRIPDDEVVRFAIARGVDVKSTRLYSPACPNRESSWHRCVYIRSELSGASAANTCGNFKTSIIKKCITSCE